MPVIEVGEKAPSFSLRDAGGKKHALSDYRGRFVVLYFYPEDDTPLCTSQACQFRDSHEELDSLNAVVLGISPDGPESHAKFEKKFGLPFTLLSDPPNAAGDPPVCVKYGAWGDKNMYGRLVRGMLRTTYLIGPDGRVVKRWDRVKTPRHAEGVIKALREAVEA